MEFDGTDYRMIGYAGAYLAIMVYLLFLLPRRYSFRKSVASCGTAFGILVLLDVWRFFVSEQYRDFLYLMVTVLQIVIVQGLALYLSKYRDLRTTFTAVNAATYVIVGNILGMAALVVVQNDLVCAVVSVCINLVVCVVMIVCVGSEYRSILEYRGKTPWGKLCVIPMMFYATFYTMAFWPRSLYANPGNILPSVFYLITMFSAHVILFKYIAQSGQEKKTIQQNTVLDSYAKGLEQQNRALMEKDEEIRILRHDMRHYLNGISMLLEQQDYEELRKKLPELSKKTEQTALVQYSENQVINSILYSKFAAAKEKEIAVTTKIYIPKKLSVNDFEFAVVLSNLLENAIDAAADCPKGERSMQVFAQAVHHKIIFECVNSYRGVIQFDEETGLPISAKGEDHGYGVQSVRAFAQKNNAMFDCFAKDQLFTARLLIQA